jgi:hypothetical protein
MSAAHMGHIMAETTRLALHNANLGSHRSDEAKAKMSAAATGRIMPLEERTKLSAIKKESCASPEWREMISARNWRGGLKASRRRGKAKRRLLGFVPLNLPFIGCEGHHIGPEQVIYMPKALHRSIYHRQTDGRGMAKINAVAYNYLFKQEVEAAMAAREETCYNSQILRS